MGCCAGKVSQGGSAREAPHAAHAQPQGKYVKQNAVVPQATPGEGAPMGGDTREGTAVGNPVEKRESMDSDMTVGSDGLPRKRRRSTVEDIREMTFMSTEEKREALRDLADDELSNEAVSEGESDEEPRPRVAVTRGNARDACPATNAGPPPLHARRERRKKRAAGNRKRSA